ncbi:MAG TPA: ATP-binding protein [Vicinamibacterales bacterium]
MSIKAKQVAGVTTLVVVVVAVLSAYHLATLARLSLEETASRGEMLAQAISKRAREVVANVEPGANPYEALGHDGGVQSLLQSSVGYSSNVNYAAIVDPSGNAVAGFPPIERSPMPQQEDLAPVVKAGPLDQLRAVYSDRTFEVHETLLAGNEPFVTIRIGVSMLLVRSELQQAANRAATTVLGALIISSLVAMLLAQWMLRPIHVIQSGLTRLGRGELDVRLDLPEQEFRDLGNSFEAVSAQLSALGRSAPATTQVEDGTVRAGGPSDFESVMDNLEDAVALFSPGGELIFNNAAMTALLHDIDAGMVSGSTLSRLAPSHPVRQLVEQTLAGRKSAGPVPFTVNAEERLVMSHAIEDTQGRFLGAMLVARNLAYLTQVHSTLNYSRKLAALGRLMAGVAHEVKNPLNAMTIHLELLKQKLTKQAAIAAGAGSGSGVALQATGPGAERTADMTKHVSVIADEIRRLDQVVVGFLKFVRPEELKLQPVHLATLISDVRTTVAADADRRGITIKSECPDNLPEINADPGMLRQALLNLAINACHAMEDGGTLRLVCRATSRHRVEIDVEDTGVGIQPEHLGRIFDLYFTTKEKGSGIGLSMVVRIVQLHDGEVEVQSTPGAGTRFRLIFPQA